MLPCPVFLFFFYINCCLLLLFLFVKFFCLILEIHSKTKLHRGDQSTRLNLLYLTLKRLNVLFGMFNLARVEEIAPLSLIENKQISRIIFLLTKKGSSVLFFSSKI